MSEVTKILLEEKEMPKAWYNIQADMPNVLPPMLNAKTKKPLQQGDVGLHFPKELLMQEITKERWIPIPEEVQEIYRLWRPSPLVRARRLEKELNTPAKIYYKYEGASPSGSHKLNTAVAQAYYCKKNGIKRVVTETGAGQWGCALSMAAAMFGLECTVYMVRVSYEQKPYRASFMKAYGAEVIVSPSMKTRSGQMILKADPDSIGSLGIATSEAVEDANTREGSHYAMGSVSNSVLLHQSVIGLEAKAQLGKVGEYPDIIIGCVGGGSNMGGLSLPFIQDKFNGKQIRVIAVEPTACPKMTKGAYVYDHGDTAKLTPLLKMYTLGSSFMPAGIHAGGLRGHAASPILSQLLHDGLIEARALKQSDIFSAALTFAKSEGILPAPESAHAIRQAIDEAVRCKEAKEPKTILFCLSGQGNLDLTAYDNYFSGDLTDYEYPEEYIAAALEKLS